MKEISSTLTLHREETDAEFKQIDKRFEQIDEKFQVINEQLSTMNEQIADLTAGQKLFVTEVRITKKTYNDKKYTRFIKTLTPIQLLHSRRDGSNRTSKSIFFPCLFSSNGNCMAWY